MNRTNLEDQGQNSPQERRSERTRRGHAESRGDDHERRKLELARLAEVSRNLGSQVEEQVQKRPYVVIGAAAGIGFVAGSLFGSRFGQVLLAAGLGYVVKNLVGGELGVDGIQAGIEKLTGEAGTG